MSCRTDDSRLGMEDKGQLEAGRTSQISETRMLFACQHGHSKRPSQFIQHNGRESWGTAVGGCQLAMAKHHCSVGQPEFGPYNRKTASLIRSLQAIRQCQSLEGICLCISPRSRQNPEDQASHNSQP